MSRHFPKIACASRRVLAIAFALAAAAGWAAEGAAKTPPPANLEPVFPAENPNLVFIEGEDAVSTNFAREAVLNYSCSGARALQLNRTSGLEGVGSFYADFVFNVPSAGTWELWYGGTPPGPREDLYPSFTSPFQMTIDDQKPLQVYREGMTVVENYTPAYYWNLVGDVTLEAQSHRISFEITEKRKIDGRYYFFLDCFFLVKKEGGKRLLADPFPPLFPKNMDERGINTPFASIDDSLIKIRDNPGKAQPLIELSLLYTLLGDYLNAIKYLNRAAIIQPKDPGITLLIAKNRVWKGDIAEGLMKYRELLEQDPQRRDIWLEAGKVAGWTGRYEDSIRFYKDGLAVFPRDPDLTINLGLTCLWASRGQEAESIFREAQGLASADGARLKDMGRVYRINGYPDRAVQAFTAAITTAPQDLEAYILLIETLQTAGKRMDAEAVQKRIVDTFAPSPRLTAFLEGFREKEGLKESVMEEYRKKLEDNPNNLVLRQVLAQTYFWNGLKAKAIEEYRHILENHAYLSVREMESQSTQLLLSIDRGYIVSGYFSRIPAMGQQARNGLSAQTGKLSQAQSARDAAAKSQEAAKAAQAKAKPGAESDKALEAIHATEDRGLAAENAIVKEAAALSGLVEQANAFLTQYEQLKLSEASGKDTIDELRQKDASAEETFAQATKASRWKFDRAGAIAEMGKDAKSNALARIVIAKIYLMDRLATEAQSLLAGHFADPGVGVGTRYTIAESWLWSGKVKEASQIISGLVENPETYIVPPYFKDLKTLLESLQSPPAPPAAVASEDPIADAKSVAVRLAEMEKDSAAQRAQAQKTLALLHTLYRHSLVRAYFAFEEKTYSIRNELGDYYLADEPPALDEAIAQFLRVLAVDPTDLSATFRLGKVYLWKRDWRSAMESFRTVYRADPYYENVAAQYNQVSREHPDSLASLASYFADTQRAQWHAEATYLQRFNSSFGLAATYQTDVIRFQQGDPRDPTTPLTDHSSYQLHDVSLGLPIDFYEANATLTPWVGGTLRANGLYEKTKSDGTVSIHDDQFEAFTAEPYVKLDTTLGLGNIFFLNSTMRWGRQPDTLDPARGAEIYDASVEANVTTLLSFIDAWPLRDTSLRTYGRVDLLHTTGFSFQNLLYTALQEITINVVKGGSPYRVLSVGGNITYQHSMNDENYLYYAPADVLLAGGTLAGSVWIGVGGGDALGLSLRGYAGTYQEEILSASPIQRFKWEAEAGVSLTQGNATYTLAAIGNSTFRYDQNAWDYWSAFVRLGCTVKLPDLLVP